MKVVVIGAGNLATRVSLALNHKGVEILQVYSRTVASAATIAHLLNCNFTNNPKAINTDADIYLIAVSDNALDEILSTINFNNKLIAHTAGSIPMNILAKFSANFGVFYPLQTFSKLRDVDFSVIPFCIEANSHENEEILVKLASMVSNDVRLIDSEQRKQLHLAAVFACNFVNHLYAMSGEIVQQKELPIDILYPLIAETASKIKTMPPRAAQTGPAKRMDTNTMNDHISMLNENEELKKLYITISESIAEYHKLPK
jgi:predicted short-subunit dehydrogenase-like oxidoreductase (DUF2520 family)